MLILTRGVGEVIRIGDDTRVVVLAIKNKLTRIGIDAPLSEKVYREEVYYRIQEDKAKAAAEHKDDSVTVGSSVEKISNTTVRYKTKREFE